MNLPDIIKKFKIDLKTVKKDYADEPYIGEEEIEHYQNGELDKEYGPPPNFQYQNCSDRYLLKNADEVNYFDQQRCSYYQTRIKHFYSRIVQNAKQKLGILFSSF
uniref:Uncharacterized protein n=1 Tax=Panagrolaimus superbus TaxID=310955 RepID=A0A914YC25_9BILA